MAWADIDKLWAIPPGKLTERFLFCEFGEWVATCPAGRNICLALRKRVLVAIAIDAITR